MSAFDPKRTCDEFHLNLFSRSVLLVQFFPRRTELNFQNGGKRVTPPQADEGHAACGQRGRCLRAKLGYIGT
jgi:hypothetical protein